MKAGLPHWNSEQAFGLKQAKATDALAYEACLYMSEACPDRFHAAGLSYDMAKCFDTVPVIFSFAYLQSSWRRLPAHQGPVRFL